MTINKFNYEAYALDYLEGNLSVEMAEEMERFLSGHPMIEAELADMMEVVILEPDTSIVYEHKEALLKEEKQVWINPQWGRPLMSAASILLLITIYFVSCSIAAMTSLGSICQLFCAYSLILVILLNA